MTRKRRLHQEGFTLIELLIVVAIVGILAGIALVRTSDTASEARLARCAYNASIGQKAYSVYVAQGGTYNPAGTTGAAFLVSAGYLASDLTGGTYTWAQGANNNITLNCTVDGATVTAPTSYNIVLASNALNNTVKEISSAFKDYIPTWMSAEGKMPTVNSANGSLSWNTALYTGTDKTNQFGAKFWQEYFSFVGVTGFDATNSQISDFKVFFKRDGSGTITSEVAGVYLQIGGTRSIYFSNGTTVANKHYSLYVDATTRQLVAP